MKNYTLNVIHNGNTKQIKVSQKELLKLQAQPNTQYQILDAQNQIVSHLETTQIADNLMITLPESNTPSIIIENFYAYVPNAETAITNGVFTTVESQAMLATEVTTSATTELSSFAKFGLASLATTGIATTAAVIHHNRDKNTNSAPADKNTQGTPKTTEPKEANDVVTTPTAPHHQGEQTNAVTTDKEPQETPKTTEAKDTNDVVTTPTAPHHQGEQTNAVTTDKEPQETPKTTEAKDTNDVVTTPTAPHHQGEQTNAVTTDKEPQETPKTPLPTPEITFDVVTQDNIVNLSESQQAVKITGKVTNVSNGQKIVLSIGEAVYEGVVNDGVFSVSVDGKTLMGHQQIQATMTVIDATGRSVSASQTQDYQVDTDITTPTIKLDVVAGDDVINLAESQSTITVSGTTDAKDGEQVLVVCQCEGCTGNAAALYQKWASVTQGKFSVDFSGEVLSKATKITASTTVTDEAGNSAITEDSHAYQVDLKAPDIAIKLDTIAGDNNIDLLLEKTKDITLTGVVTGEFKPTDTVTLTIGTAEITGIALSDSGQFSYTTTGEVLASAQPLLVKAYISSEDEAGNKGEAVDSHSYSTSQGELKIQLDEIAFDDLINVTEAQNVITTLSGVVTGLSQTTAIGQTVTIKLNEQTYSGVIGEDYRFNVDVPTQALLENPQYVVEANLIDTVTTSRNYKVADYHVADIQITNIDQQFVQNQQASNTGNVRLIGHIDASESALGIGLNTHKIHRIELTIGGEKFVVGVNRDTLEFAVDVPADKWNVAAGQAISYKIIADTSYKPNLYNYKPSTTDGIDYTVVEEKVSAHLSTLKVLFDSNNVEKTDTGYNVKTVEPVATITGKVSGNAKAGDIILLTIGNEQVQTNVKEDLTFSTEINQSVLSKNTTGYVLAQLQTKDLAGNLVNVEDSANYISATIRSQSGDFVNPHSYIKPADRVLTHTDPKHNFSYVVNNLDANQYQGFLKENKIAVGGTLGKTPVVKYHFVSQEEVANGIANTISYIQKSPEKLYKTFDDRHKTLFRNAYDSIEKYANIKFEEVSTVAESQSNLYWGTLGDPFSASSAVAVSGHWIAWNSKLNNTDTFVESIMRHEILHTLGTTHTGRYNKIEDGTEFSLMSYNFNDYFNGPNWKGYSYRDLRMFDLAYVHWRLGVNPEARKDNDTYGFQSWDTTKVDGGIYVWDGGGIDTFDASTEKEAVYVNLTPGSWNYRGEKKDTLVVASRKTYTNEAEYLGLDSTKTFDGKEINYTVVDYQDGQSMIGYGTQIENLIGSDYNDTLIGNNADNHISGRAGNDDIKGGLGNDYLDGGLGDDRLAGEAGDDIYVVDSINDSVIELTAEGTDTVYSTVTYQLAENVEHLTLLGSNAIDGSGNGLDNQIIGNSAENKLNGLVGDDRLIGGRGSDLLTGGEGRDTFVFNSMLDGTVDTITDFSQEDSIELSQAVFSAVNSANLFEYIRYESSTGKLSYSQTGQDNNLIHFATLQNVASIEASQFVIA